MLKCLNPACGKEFLYASKHITTSNVTVPVKFDTTTCQSTILNYPETVETHNCPFCQNLNIAEVEKTEPQITSIMSVKIAEADEWIKKGYEVKDTYANSVTLIKKKEEKQK